MESESMDVVVGSDVGNSRDTTPAKTWAQPRRKSTYLLPQGYCANFT